MIQAPGVGDGFGRLVAVTLLAVAPLTVSAATAETEPRLTPTPALTALAPHVTVLSSDVATDKPLPRPRVKVPKLPPPLSSPLAGTTLVREDAPPLPPSVPETKPAPETKPVPEAAAAGRPMIRYAATEINLRARPEPDAHRIDVIDEGTALEVIGAPVNGKWVKVARRGQVLGYVATEFLLAHPPKPH